MRTISKRSNDCGMSVILELGGILHGRDENHPAVQSLTPPSTRMGYILTLSENHDDDRKRHPGPPAPAAVSGARGAEGESGDLGLSRLRPRRQTRRSDQDPPPRALRPAAARPLQDG